MILLDTHSLIWWVNHGPELSVAALRAIEHERPEGEILISAISAWEVADLSRRGHLGLRMAPAAWLTRIAELPEVRFVPVDQMIAVHAAGLPTPLEANPVERIALATARRLGCPLVSGNPRLRDYPDVRIIW